MSKALRESDGPTTLERELGRLRRVHLMQLLRSPSEPGLSPLATELLRVVVEAGSIRASDLASTLFVTKTSISRYVNEMLHDGLLVQRRDPTDGRATLLSLSSTGRRALEEREGRRTAVLHELCGGWPKGDVATLTRLLKRLNDVSQIRRMEQRVR
ncbi:MAG TPA: MarR family transcriptional regulator [Acidimicrobiales bacterium]|nr:MarR family transcriptional regulator [Acidimicrobiales bacterium]